MHGHTEERKGLLYALLFYKKSFRAVLQKNAARGVAEEGNLRICKFMKSISMAQKCRRRYAVYKENRVYARAGKDGLII